ncbi:aspartate--tRNA ligase [Mycoplasmopsis cricetuli]|uniref:aspartate--tRNA ligase n=1 Tax=Mycoplasmopsis cricetuli TaxID=171283 RepID=UPI00046F7643|nr:aspartate--tRNA ligase [Mycoplasmopsis cricetuli]
MEKIINNNELRLTDVNKEVILYGWVANKRKFGELSFVDLRDKFGITQVVFNQEINFSRESVLEIKGIVVPRKDPNKNISTGEIEVLVKNYKVLSNAAELPFLIRDDIETKEDIRLKHRFLDLRRPIMQKTLKLRNDIFYAIREFMQKNDFMEIETPILAKTTPEGARDYLVPTRQPDSFFALPQSPQLFKQMLMISGFEKYYQFARCFRDEDLRKDRQPEFTQLDIETSFMSVESFMNFIEKLFAYFMKKVLKTEIKIPFKRLDFDDCIDWYGTDKPDLRYEQKIENINDFCLESDFNIIKNASSKRLLLIDEIITKKQFKKLEEIAKKNKANALFYFTVENGKLKESNFATKALLSVEKLITEKQKQNGTFLIVANEYNNASQALGALRVELNQWYNWASDEYNFHWVVNWPMFEFNHEDKTWSAAHHPFTQFDNTIEEINNLPKSKLKAKSYDLVLNGFELGSGSARIFDKEMQTKMFELIGMNKQEQETKFGFFLKALSYGVPPHCGIGLGMDRLLMILSNQTTIRDVIAFPKNAKGQDVLLDSPSSVDENQLQELFIHKIK